MNQENKDQHLNEFLRSLKKIGKEKPNREEKEADKKINGTNEHDKSDDGER